MGTEGLISSPVGFPAGQHWKGVEEAHWGRAQLGSEIHGAGMSKPVWQPMKQLSEVSVTSIGHKGS